jgi:urease accessory protein
VSAANDLAAFFAGLLHPLLTPTHALGLVALGLLISQQASGRRMLPQLIFALALAAGLLALVDAISETPAGEMLLAGAAISGALVAARFPLPLWLTGAIATAIGAAIGLDSPPEVISLEEAAFVLLGTLIGATLSLGAIVAVASRLARGWQKIAVRVLGSWTAASALLALAVRFAAS